MSDDHRVYGIRMPRASTAESLALQPIDGALSCCALVQMIASGKCILTRRRTVTAISATLASMPIWRKRDRHDRSVDRLMPVVGYLAAGALLAWFCARACEYPSLA